MHMLASLVLLQSPHPGVDPVCGQQSNMRASLDDAAAIEDENFVGVDDRR